jgi:hypothetical protein
MRASLVPSLAAGVEQRSTGQAFPPFDPVRKAGARTDNALCAPPFSSRDAPARCGMFTAGQNARIVSCPDTAFEENETAPASDRQGTRRDVRPA